jgi:hypothetical protein
MDTNRETILNIVEKNFYLSKEGLAKFKQYYANPFIDDVYKKIVGDQVKARFEVPSNFCEKLDEGWSDFKSYFSNFVNEYKIKYENFRDNKIIVNKNERKVIKLLEEYYFTNPKVPLELLYNSFGYYKNRNETPEQTKKNLTDRIKKVLDNIGAKKLSRGKIELVFTMDFADWFLCSTAEKWSSCISLESHYDGSYWSGLPGLVGDKSRAMLYVTDGVKKTYCGITTDRYLSRSWVLLGNDNIPQIVRFYPSDIISGQGVSELTKTTFRSEPGREFRSKHPIDVITFQNGKSAGVFQDGFGLCSDGYLRYGHHGYNYLFKGRIYSDSIFSCTEGLASIVKNGHNLGKYSLEPKQCHECHIHIDRGYEKIGTDGEFYCNRCYSKKFYTCSNCGTTDEIVNAVEATNGHKYCKVCYEQRFTKCPECNRELQRGHNGNFKDNAGKEICEACYWKTHVVCCICGNGVGTKQNKVKTKSGKVFCAPCAEKEGVKLHKHAPRR